jgi:hypothetical protein
MCKVICESIKVAACNEICERIRTAKEHRQMAIKRALGYGNFAMALQKARGYNQLLRHLYSKAKARA